MDVFLSQNQNKMTVTLVILLLILAAVDISSLLSGYFPCDNYFYWMSDLNGGVIPLFKEDLSIFFNSEIESLRNLILTMVCFAASLTLSSIFLLGFFMKRKFVASQWPLALWKLSTLLLGFRLAMAYWISHKFHFTLLKDILMELEDVDDKGIDEYTFSLMQLYANGTIGLIPAGLVVSIVLNLIILTISVSVIMETDEWRRLNIKKRIY